MALIAESHVTHIQNALRIHLQSSVIENGPLVSSDLIRGAKKCSLFLVLRRMLLGADRLGIQPGCFYSEGDIFPKDE